MIGDVEVRSSGDKGWGVYARRAFVEGEFIFRRRHARVAMDPERQADLLAHAPAFIRREYRRRQRVSGGR